MSESIAARTCFRPHRRQTELQRGDAAPCAKKIALGAKLHGGRAGGVVRGDEVNGSLGERGPELLAIFALADRGSAFELRRAAGNVFRRKGEVVRTSFDGYARAAVFREAQGGQSVRGREMDDVDRRVEFQGQAQKEIDGFVFRFTR